MSELVERLYPLPDIRRTPLSSLRWWESRRLFYNKVVGAAGVVTLAGFSVMALLPPDPMPVRNLPGLLVGAAIYGILANGCYSLGWLADMAARALWGRRAPDLGPLLFRQGLIFSVGLTLLPLLFAVLIWVARVVEAIAT
jgi:hypothetical protein